MIELKGKRWFWSRYVHRQGLAGLGDAKENYQFSWCLKNGLGVAQMHDDECSTWKNQVGD